MPRREEGEREGGDGPEVAHVQKTAAAGNVIGRKVPREG